MALTAEIKVRVSQATKAAIESIATSRGEGVGISDIAREAVKEYLDRHRLKPVSESPPPMRAQRRA